MHPDPAYTVDMYVLEREDGMDREIYMVLPEVQSLVLDELRLARVTYVNRRGTLALWPIRLPVEGNDRNRRVAETALSVRSKPSRCGFGSRGTPTFPVT